MWLETLAVPLTQSPVRRGERFKLRADLPLKIGPATDARLRLALQGNSLELRLDGEQVVLTVAEQPIPSAVNGEELGRGARVVLRAGDVLAVHPGFAFGVRDRTQPPARDEGLEARIAAAPSDDGAWAVYGDFLEERGDPLGAWLRHTERSRDDLRRALGPLAVSERTGAVLAAWTGRGFLTRVSLARSAVVGPPGLFWHLEQLAVLPVARFLEGLRIDYFVGTPARVDSADATPSDVLMHLLDVVERSPWRHSLRRLDLGQSSRPFPLAAFEPRLRAVLPKLDSLALIHHGTRAVVEVESVAEGVSLVGLRPGERWVVLPRTELGASTRCRLRLVGEGIPERVCELDRLPDGPWHVFELGTDAMKQQAPRLKLNGVATSGAVLHHGDQLEPWPGVRLRFWLE